MLRDMQRNSSKGWRELYVLIFLHLWRIYLYLCMYDFKIIHWEFYLQFTWLHFKWQYKQRTLVYFQALDIIFQTSHVSETCL